MGFRAATKVKPHLGSFIYLNLNKNPNPVINGLEPPNKQIIGDPFTSLLVVLFKIFK